MKADYLNPIAIAFQNALEGAAQLLPKRGAISKEGAIDTSKDISIALDFGGDLKGFFLFNFDKSVAIELAKRMTGGMSSSDELDEMGESCITEIGSMIKNGAVTQLNEAGYKCEISDKLHKKGSMPFYPPMNALKVSVETEAGEIEALFCLTK